MNNKSGMPWLGLVRSARPFAGMLIVTAVGDGTEEHPVREITTIVDADTGNVLAVLDPLERKDEPA